ncbi:hypothetical protein [Cetobacterium sp.]|uniref:hypothetical protein n=1 Tax=Cetobacterium sp. TaxID=2071632 RepID=UPI002FCC5FB0
MKKIILIIGVLGLVVGCSNNKEGGQNTSPRIVGGYQNSNIDTRGNMALSKLIQEKHIGKNFKVMDYKKQIVAGINHKFILEINGEVQEFVVFESLKGEFTVQ